MFLVFVQQPGAASPALVRQRGGVAGLLVGLDPVVHALPGHAEQTGDLGGRAALVVFQDGDGAPEEARIPRFRALAPEALPLPGSQVKPAHGRLLPHGSAT
jgi:hypothetical protein